jgi:hypothetical protein
LISGRAGEVRGCDAEFGFVSFQRVRDTYQGTGLEPGVQKRQLINRLWSVPEILRSYGLEYREDFSTIVNIELDIVSFRKNGEAGIRDLQILVRF